MVDCDPIQFKRGIFVTYIDVRKHKFFLRVEFDMYLREIIDAYLDLATIFI